MKELVNRSPLAWSITHILFLAGNALVNMLVGLYRRKEYLLLAIDLVECDITLI